MNTIRAFASPDALVIYGTAYDDSLGDDIRVTVVATGLSRQGQQRRTAPPLQVLRTGTDNVPFHVPTLTNTVQGGQGQAPTAGIPQPDYGSLGTPAVWRTNRTSAAAKVDALSSGGMDDYEIPAFLRKQADWQALFVGGGAWRRHPWSMVDVEGTGCRKVKFAPCSSNAPSSP
jgi:cell division protein FtsZ